MSIFLNLVDLLDHHTVSYQAQSGSPGHAAVVLLLYSINRYSIFHHSIICGYHIYINSCQENLQAGPYMVDYGRQWRTERRFATQIKCSNHVLSNKQTMVACMLLCCMKHKQTTLTNKHTLFEDVKNVCSTTFFSGMTNTTLKWCPWAQKIILCGKLVPHLVRKHEPMIDFLCHIDDPGWWTDGWKSFT